VTRRRTTFAVVLSVLGVFFLLFGVALLNIPAALIVAGVALVAIGMVGVDVEDDAA
jgi:hypothetical protein